MWLEYNRVSLPHLHRQRGLRLHCRLQEEMIAVMAPNDGAKAAQPMTKLNWWPAPAVRLKKSHLILLLIDTPHIVKLITRNVSKLKLPLEVNYQPHHQQIKTLVLSQ